MFCFFIVTEQLQDMMQKLRKEKKRCFVVLLIQQIIAVQQLQQWLNTSKKLSNKNSLKELTLQQNKLNSKGKLLLSFIYRFSVVAKGVKALVRGLESKLEPAFTSMTKMPWVSWESVEDQSEYVNQITTYVQQTVPVIMDWLMSPAHFSFFCDSFCLYEKKKEK